ncbi:uncharacterized protein ASPGLDRAFT_41028 [Aspergillus glaucus CBS 516.65]|uniref:Uncharacterized protein n=1 Tax=Aspergillus glaucus CBS 516.65 TaxID=1160497 RepID=A0A1L9VYW6_ASPGL|nr:hypothetical protein ASPGLDRAFT_41028 [Aspergillus glaucus CBS 516.65]OJJ89095.1 hypothetical protein ASPGLDRAFT_41028 [Aspergillus glaucus CBS 516.65]
MYYVLYLSSLCKRRHWPDPLYSPYKTTTPSPTTGPNTGPNPNTNNPGYTCTVRVNNREYQTDTICESEQLARENAAMRAYLICRNFSVNDGMYPTGHDHGGIVQGVPVAIGTGRKGRFQYGSDGFGEVYAGVGNGYGAGRVGSESGASSGSGGVSP